MGGRHRNVKGGKRGEAVQAHKPVKDTMLAQVLPLRASRLFSDTGGALMPAFMDFLTKGCSQSAPGPCRRP